MTLYKAFGTKTVSSLRRILKIICAMFLDFDGQLVLEKFYTHEKHPHYQIF